MNELYERWKIEKPSNMGICRNTWTWLIKESPEWFDLCSDSKEIKEKSAGLYLYLGKMNEWECEVFLNTSCLDTSTM